MNKDIFPILILLYILNPPLFYTPFTQPKQARLSHYRLLPKSNISLMLIKSYAPNKARCNQQYIFILFQLNDLRNLLQSTSIEGDEYIKQLEQENKEMKQKSERVQAALKCQHRMGAHLETVGLYWRDFVNANQ